MTQARAYATLDATAPLAPFVLDRREPGPSDVQMDILFCGVCHSDLHTVRSEWPGTVYPCVPGHEIVGRVARVGEWVSGFKAGDLAAVGCMVDSCQACASCLAGLEQYCEPGMTLTYNSPDNHIPGKVTYGGYSSHIVVDERFCLHVPDALNPAAVAPLLCAGITTYSPLRHWGVRPGMKVGIVGLGGLGHMGVKLSHGFGAHTVLFTTSTHKTEDGVRLGADEIVLSTDADAMARRANTFELILDTVPGSHSLDPYVSLLKRDGTLVVLGVPPTPNPSPSMLKLILKRRQIAGSTIGGIAETQEMLDFCAEHGIVSDIEIIPIQNINEAYERMKRGDVKYRFVIDMSSLSSG